MNSLTTVIDGFMVHIEYDDNDITGCFMGWQSSLNVWRVLNDDFRLKVFDEVFKKPDSTKG